MVTSEFEPLARSCARARSYPDLPFVVLPHPFETLSPESVRALMEKKFDETVAALVTPVDQRPAPRA